jgi:hypothetical protein
VGSQNATFQRKRVNFRFYICCCVIFDPPNLHFFTQICSFFCHRCIRKIINSLRSVGNCFASNFLLRYVRIIVLSLSPELLENLKIKSFTLPTLGYLGLPWATLGYLGLPWATLGYLGLHWATPGIIFLGARKFQGLHSLCYFGHLQFNSFVSFSRIA